MHSSVKRSAPRIERWGDEGIIPRLDRLESDDAIDEATDKAAYNCLAGAIFYEVLDEPRSVLLGSQ